MCCSFSDSILRHSFNSNNAVISTTAHYLNSAMAPLIKAQTATKFAAAPKCPANLLSNGLKCIVNEIESCPTGYVCLGHDNIHGICCKAVLKCTNQKKLYYVVKKQVIICFLFKQ